LWRWLPTRFTGNRFVRTAKRSLPAVILLLLIVYSLKDTPFLEHPWGVPELSSLALVLGLQLWTRNALLSIGVGTGFFMLWSNQLIRF